MEENADNYHEVKRLFCKMLGVPNCDNLEDEDIIIPIYVRKISEKQTSQVEASEVVLEDKNLRTSYYKMKEMNWRDVQLYSEDCFEVAVRGRWSRRDSIQLNDSVNGIDYSYGDASLCYILMLCERMCTDETQQSEAQRAVRFNGRIPMHEDSTFEDYLARVFRISTIRIKSNKKMDLNSFEKYCDAFEYLYMYKTRHSIMKIMDISDLYERNGGGRSRVSTLDEPPRRTVNQETLEYYAMAVDSEDPFTAYISFYHVLEFYYDEVYKKKLVDEMKNRLTDPSFSYKNDKKIYDLAKWVGKKMKNDDEIGRGNELDSLKYVLEEYAPIEKIVSGLDEWNKTLKDYYQNNNVSFSGSKKDKIMWEDNAGVYTNLANRIYNTRNSLVHSKSGQSDKQYKPQKHKSILAKELPLIQVISELILFENGDIL